MITPTSINHSLSTSIFRTYHFGLEGRLNLPVCEAFPVDASEEGMVSDVPLSLTTAAQTLGWMLGHQLLNVRNKDENMDLSHRKYRRNYMIVYF